VGAAIANHGTVSLVNCTLKNNHATGGAGSQSHGYGSCRAGTGGEADGAAIWNQGAVSITMLNCTLNDNGATGGTGGATDGTGTAAGTGGLGRGGAIFSQSPVAVTNCTFSGNKAAGGNGGTVASSSTGYPVDGGAAQGGGIFSAGSIQMLACTLGNNSAVGGSGSTTNGSLFGGNGGNASAGGLAQQGTAIIGNTIFSGDLATGGSGNVAGSGTGNDVAGSVSSLGHNLVSSAAGSSGWAGSDLQGVNALLGPLQDNGGLTYTMALWPISPAVDAGDDTLDGGLSGDQRGNARVTGAHVDIGAYELGYSVLNANDSGAGSLRQAIASARTNDVIVFAPAVTTITLTSGQIVISNQGLTIFGPTNQGVSVSGNFSGRVFNIAANAAVNIYNLTIRNGSVLGAAGNSNQNGTNALGGGILNQGTLGLINCTIRDNSALGGGGGDGFPLGGSGGYGLGGGAANLGTLGLTNCTLSGNSASGGYGGNGVLAPAGNGGAGFGGGLYNQAALSLNSCTLKGNSASGGAGGTGFGNGFTGAGSGGGIYQTNGLGSTSIGNTIVAGNTASSSPDFAGVAITAKYNLIGIANGSSGWWNVPGRSVDFQGSLASPIDPLLGPLQDNGGPTFTMLPQAGSLAIDNGNRALATDQRGFPGSVNIPGYAGGSDRGAVEIQTLSLDIGLRLFDGTATNKIAGEIPASSALRISKNGTTYGILLVPTNSPSASKFRIQTASGTKALQKLP
jgi:hypothetical protein